jgi:hypothetical protein
MSIHHMELITVDHLTTGRMLRHVLPATAFRKNQAGVVGSE